MRNVSLDEREWQQVLSFLAQAPWGQVNGLIMKIGQQVRTVEPATAAMKGNSGPEDHAEAH